MLNTGEFTASITAYFQEKYADPALPLGAFAHWKEEYIKSIGSRTKYDPVEVAKFWYTELAKLDLGKNTSPKQLHTEFETYVRESVLQYFYEDTLHTLEELTSLGVILCLFTQGVEAWQLLKVVHIEKFFTLQFVNPDKTSEESMAHVRSELTANQLSGRPLLLVDDSPAIVNRFHNALPEAELFLITRPREELTYAEEKIEAPVTHITKFLPVLERVRELLRGTSSAAE